MPDEEGRVCLATLGGGVALERFDDELERVLRNIVDPMTPATAKREITLKVSFKPDASRDLGKVEIAVSSKLAATEKQETRVFISQTRNGPVATEHNPRQPQLPFAGEAPQGRPTVTPIRKDV